MSSHWNAGMSWSSRICDTPLAYNVCTLRLRHVGAVLEFCNTLLSSSLSVSLYISYKWSFLVEFSSLTLEGFWWRMHGQEHGRQSYNNKLTIQNFNFNFRSELTACDRRRRQTMQTLRGRTAPDLSKTQQCCIPQLTCLDVPASDWAYFN